MDPLNLIYYAVVCGGLAAFAPQVSNRVQRLVLGLGVGAASAALLPLAHSVIGF